MYARKTRPSPKASRSLENTVYSAARLSTRTHVIIVKLKLNVKSLNYIWASLPSKYYPRYFAGNTPAEVSEMPLALQVPENRAKLLL